MYGYIYKITDLKNGKCYIGQHKYDKPELDPKYHGSGYLIKKIYNTRPETLLEEILMICETLEEANYFEEYFIEHLNTMHPYGYNLIEGGKCRKPSRYTRIKQSRAAKRHAKESGERLRQYNLSHEPWNKGTKGVCKPNKTTFKKGHKNSEESIRKQIESNTRFKFTHDELYELYINQNLTANQIAQIYGCKRGTILKNLKRHKIDKPKEFISQQLSSRKGKALYNYKQICPLLLYKYLIIDKLPKKQVSELFDISYHTLHKRMEGFKEILKNNLPVNEWVDIK